MEDIMKKRQKEIERVYEEQWDGGKGSHHPDFDPEAVSWPGSACQPDKGRPTCCAVLHCTILLPFLVRSILLPLTDPICSARLCCAVLVLRCVCCVLRAAGG